jgi:putative peptide zinc metalloprotease protein
VTADGLGPASVLRVAPLAVTAQAGGFVVGRPDVGRFVVLPEVGMRALDCLRAGQTVEATSRAVTPTTAAEPVDVLGFARSLVQLGFAAPADAAPADAGRQSGPPMAQPRPAGESARGGIALAPRARLTWLFTLPVVLAALACSVPAALVMVLVPDVRPRAYDVFFLDTPARSLAVLTLVTYALALVHELAHVYAAAAVGVPARVRITRRLYFLTFETNLTGLWALPARRRIAPLTAGMGFDAVVLLAALVLRALHLGPDRLLAAVALVQLSAIVSQFFVFLRTDVYAVMTALLGCVNLSTTTKLLLRRPLRLLSAEHLATLAATRPRDLAVARWYRWVHLAGMVLAAWFFIVFFLPSTVHLLQWMWTSTTTAGPTTEPFYEAVVLGLLLLTPRALTVVIAIRDALPRRRRPVA